MTPTDAGSKSEPDSLPEDAPDPVHRLLGSTALRLAGVAAVALGLATLALGAGQVVPALSGTDPAADGSYLRYEEHGCYGTCPQFVVTVCGDGGASYVGHRFVEETGRVEYSVSEREADRLFSLVREVGYFDLRPEYEGNIVDGPSATVTVGLDGEMHRVDFQPYAAPDGLLSLADAVHDTARPYADQRDDSGEFDGEVGDASAVC